MQPLLPPIVAAAAGVEHARLPGRLPEAHPEGGLLLLRLSDLVLELPQLPLQVLRLLDPLPEPLFRRGDIRTGGLQVPVLLRQLLLVLRPDLVDAGAGLPQLPLFIRQRLLQTHNLSRAPFHREGQLGLLLFLLRLAVQHGHQLVLRRLVVVLEALHVGAERLVDAPQLLQEAVEEGGHLVEAVALLLAAQTELQQPLGELLAKPLEQLDGDLLEAEEPVPVLAGLARLPSLALVQDPLHAADDALRAVQGRLDLRREGGRVGEDEVLDRHKVALQVPQHRDEVAAHADQDPPAAGSGLRHELARTLLVDVLQVGLHVH
mmetsp:Transcript_152566/g.266412  ORF Transcript_152566/g.266412 Transcript_152566/m.266412 type:complete len:319 (+) Transcript_152566:238-1194(+)